MEQPNSPLYLTALTVIAYILLCLWLVIPNYQNGKMIYMANNDTSSLLDSLLFTASNKWGIDENQIMENMNKIAFHESKNKSDAIQKSSKAQSGVGPGRGLFQFDVGEGEGANTAFNRLISQLGKMNEEEPKFVKEMQNLQNMNLNAFSKSGYDVSVLSPEEQQILFLGNLLQMPSKKEEGYKEASFADIDTDEKLAEYWAQYHHAGTKPGTEEYKKMIDKFTKDIAYYK